MTFRILTEGGFPLITEGDVFLVTAYEVVPVATASGSDPSFATRCPMCDGDLISLYGLRCRRCGTRVVRFPGVEIT